MGLSLTKIKLTEKFNAHWKSTAKVQYDKLTKEDWQKIEKKFFEKKWQSDYYTIAKSAMFEITENGKKTIKEFAWEEIFKVFFKTAIWFCDWRKREGNLKRIKHFTNSEWIGQIKSALLEKLFGKLVNMTGYSFWTSEPTIDDDKYRDWTYECYIYNRDLKCILDFNELFYELRFNKTQGEYIDVYENDVWTDLAKETFDDFKDQFTTIEEAGYQFWMFYELGNENVAWVLPLFIIINKYEMFKKYKPEWLDEPVKNSKRTKREIIEEAITNKQSIVVG